MANELKYENSPYLQQHANNPVHWFAWNNKAFLKAKKENKLIFLSIGYSTCHWCHVMEEESFEDEGVAKILNDDFISIKVDREEMPDVDKYYQDMHYLLQRRAGGWPLSLILLPDKRVIFATTYLPKEDRGRMAGIKTLLLFFNKKFHENLDELQKSALSIEKAFDEFKNHELKPAKIEFSIIDDFIENINKSFDNTNKGIGNAPKFPHASTFDVLLDIYAITKDKQALKLANEALEAMANGGINDQIEGGFYRYSVDEKWQIPHFEKMLYTNAELISAYSKLYAIIKNEKYKQIVKQTIKAMNERFLHEELYFSASDADSEGEEGKYFVFDYDKAKKALLEGGLSKDEVKEILSYLNIDSFGNFENATTNPYLTSQNTPKKIDKAKEILKNLRLHVSYPFIDKKVLTSWNALFVTSLFNAGEKVDNKYTKMAFQSLDEILKTLHVKGNLYHQYLPNSTPKVKALLEDYAFLSEALIKAYEISEDKKYLDLAKKFTLKAKEDFYRDGHWYLGYFKALASFEDNAYKSPMATIMENMATLSLFLEDTKMFFTLSKMLEKNSANLSKYPHAYPTAVYLWLKMHKKEILLKVPKHAKDKTLKEIKKLNNPLLHVITHESPKYQACKVQTCFANEDNLEKVLAKVRELE